MVGPDPSYESVEKVGEHKVFEYNHSSVPIGIFPIINENAFYLNGNVLGVVKRGKRHVNYVLKNPNDVNHIIKPKEI
jgi:hypothetical protein